MIEITLLVTAPATNIYNSSRYKRIYNWYLFIASLYNR